MVELAQVPRRFGYWGLQALLRPEGAEANHKRGQRLYRLAGLMVRHQRKRERVAFGREALALPMRPNEVRSMALVMDRLDDGRRLKVSTKDARKAM
jgi:putative transposase